MNPDSIASSPGEMMQLGATFAATARPGDIFALTGDLGSGKTHWTKGFIGQIQPDTIVTSPTFGIVNSYTGGSPAIHHFDFYRIKSANELIDLGWDEYLDDHGIIICEWADLFPQLFPDHAVWLEFTHLQGDSRRVTQSNRKSR
jgi:tRNA threonylcarbamoyladenosine biosynthesis protein TsaE